MQIKAVLFDLDGSLLPMDQDEFIKAYFTHLSMRMAKFGYDPKELVSTIWAGTKNMMKNNGTCSNEDVFWKAFSETYGEKYLKDRTLFDDYYHNEFLKVKDVCGYNAKAKEAVERIKQAGYRVVLATQPIFPSIATKHRTNWAGLDVSDFEFFTAFENIGYCKPNLKYYEEICNRLGVSPSECLMVGNDTGDDMVAEKLGMQVFLLTDCLINQSGEDIEKYRHGSFAELLEFLNI
ncbi:MAG: HAD family hydrolase [Ruminococcaceae bacterium]|nr:HAD family hydrolase [Oscillospiraceae bacterium]